MVDNKEFFFSSKGKFNPEDELEATIHAFFMPDPEVSEDQQMQAQCAFPARFYWLKKQIPLDSTRLPFRKCIKLQNWYDTLNPESISVVFASYHLASPASVMGHTLFKINTKGNKNKELLDYGVNYAASTDDTNPFLYAYRGLTGNYSGQFSIYPYYIKVNEYADMEARDMWDYELSLEGDEIKRFMLHLWELLWQAKFDYFFFDENCSYHMMPLIEFARPEVKLIDQFNYIVSPPETIKAYLSNKGLVRNIRYRPSLYTKIKQKIFAMNERERSLFFGKINQKKTDSLEEEPREDLILDTILDTYRYWKSKGNDNSIIQSQYREYLNTRSKVEKDSYQIDEQKELNTRPEESHSSSRIAIQKGNSSLGNFTDLKFRIAQHDMLNFERGYVPNSDLIVGDFSFRFNESTNKAYLDRLIFLGATSINPYNAVSRSESYKFEISIDSVMKQKKDFWADLLGNNPYQKIHPLQAEGYYGRTWNDEYSNFWRHISLGAMVGAKAQISQHFQEGYRTGPGGLIHLIINFQNWKFHYLGGYYYYKALGSENDFLNQYRIRYSFHKDFEFRVEHNNQLRFEETYFSIHYHY